MSLKPPSALVAVLVMVAACRTAPAGPDIAMPVERAAAVVPGPAPTTPRPEGATADFVAVAEGQALAAGLVRLPGGPVLVVDRAARAIYETGSDGSMRPFAPLGTHIAEHVPEHLTLTRVTGVWPAAMEVELYYGARTESYSESFAVDIAKSKVKALGRKAVTLGMMPWKDGRVLAFTSPDGGMGWTQRGKFQVASGPPMAVPKLPSNAMFMGGFAAYESGAVIAHATILPPEGSDGEWESTTVFVFADGVHRVAHTMPSAVHDVIRGRVVEETLVAHEHGLRRYDPSGWVDVPLPADATAERYKSLTIDDDGTAWLVLGDTLYRASLPALAWTPVALPAGFVPMEVAATTSKDVWVVDDNGVVLHRGGGPSRQPIALPEDQDGFVRLVTKGQEPHPDFAGCQIPLVVLGTTAETKEADVLAVVIPGAIDGSFARGKLGDRSVYTYATTFRDPQTLAALRRHVPKLKKKFPDVRLACARATDTEPLAP